MKDTLNKSLAEHTGKDIKDIEKDCERDYFMTASEAKDYGLIDNVVVSRPVELKPKA
jgi:ATP-dependent Clp protease protease subunit